MLLQEVIKMKHQAKYNWYEMQSLVPSIFRCKVVFIKIKYFNIFAYLTLPCEKTHKLTPQSQTITVWNKNAAKVNIQKKYEIFEKNCQTHHKEGRIIEQKCSIQEQVLQVYTHPHNRIPSNLVNLIIKK